MTKNLETFTGEGFSDWKFKLRTTAMAVFDANTVTVLDEVAMEVQEIDINTYRYTAHSEFAKEASRQLYFVFTQKTSKEPFDLIKNVTDLNGLEAWRRLNMRYDAKTVGKRVALIRKTVNPQKVKSAKDAPRHD